MATSYANALIISVVVLTLLNGNFYVTAEEKDTFQEELYIKPLESGHVYTHFQFTTDWQVQLGDNSGFDHYHLLSKPLGEVLTHYSVQELHLSLTQGRWNYDDWGYPVEDAPPGAEVWVWFQEGTPNVDTTWTDLINVLSGIFCASLNFMDSTATVSPHMTFLPKGVSHNVYLHRYGHRLLRYAALPREAVCTENLTPWKKLLPCGSQVGLASLLNAQKLYDASYNSIGVHFRPLCQNEECNETKVELTQNVAVVFDPIAVPTSGGKQDWTLKKLFGKGLSGPCPLASSSHIFVDTSNNKSSFTLTPEPTEVKEFKRGNHKTKFAVYDIFKITSGNKALYLGSKYDVAKVYQQIKPPSLHATRFQTGFGQEKGGIVCLIYNHHPKKQLPIVYMDVVPWFLRMFYHTLTVETFDASQQYILGNGTTLTPDKVFYQPGRDRERPYHLELMLTLPANSVTRLSFQFERALLKWTEYPPDANHGFYVDSAVIIAQITDARHYTAPAQHSSNIKDVMTDDSQSFFLRLHTESLLVILPTPDFSMPYNVICLACTVVAIAFGSIHNMTTRRFVIKDPSKKGILGKLKAKIFREKLTEEISESVEVDTDKTEKEIKKKDEKDSPGVRKRESCTTESVG